MSAMMYGPVHIIPLFVFKFAEL
jgi:hypothetical protein